MTSPTKRSAMDWIRFTGLVVLVTFLSFFIHEQAHYWAGALQGFDMWFNMNSAGSYDAVPPSPAQQTIITMAGPIITLLQAALAAVLIKGRHHFWLYSFVIAAFWQRAYAFATSVFIYPNDEARISLLYGWPVWFLPSIIVGALLTVTVWAAFKARAGLITNILSYIAVTAAMAVVVLGTQAYPIRLG